MFKNVVIVGLINP